MENMSSTFKLKPEEKELQQIATLIVQTRDSLERRIEKTKPSLLKIQESCRHRPIQECGTSDQGKKFIMEFKGKCPICYKEFLSPFLVRILSHQYSS